MSSPQTPVDSGSEDALPGLLELFANVPESRKPRGLIFPLAFILAASLLAMLGGAAYFRQIADQVTDFPQELLLRKLGGRWCYFLSRFRTPCDRTFRRVFECVDVERLETEIGAWLWKRAQRDDDGALRLAIDGKVLRGVWTDENELFTLFSAMIHREGVTIAQVKVPSGTNEITQVKALLAPVTPRAGEHVIVTMDAAHTQHDTAEYLVGTRGFDYIMTTKGNQPTLLDTVATNTVPLVKNTPDHTVRERNRGRINTWETWTANAQGANFHTFNKPPASGGEPTTSTGRKPDKNTHSSSPASPSKTLRQATCMTMSETIGGSRTKATTFATPSGMKTRNISTTEQRHMSKQRSPTPPTVCSDSTATPTSNEPPSGSAATRCGHSPYLSPNVTSDHRR